jgi:cysteine desulfurase
MRRIYLDYNASTPVHPEVARAMHAAEQGSYGNPSSTHWSGSEAKSILERSRAQVASLLGCAPQEVVFTSGGSEASNLALKGLYFSIRDRPAHIITSTIEHPSIVEPCRFLERLGARITRLSVDRTGRVDPEDLQRAISPDTILISLMHANNEVGTIQPIEACASIARAHGVPLHTDAAQSVGKIPTAVDELGVSMLTIAGHKMYAPKGVGALYVRSGLQLESLIHGAGHERGRRAGTESAMLAAALGMACELALDLSWTVGARELRDYLWTSLKKRHGEAVILNGHAEYRLPNTLNVSFVNRVSADLLAEIGGVAASGGSACHSGRVELSPVLAAMKVPEHEGMGAVRFSLGRDTTRLDIDEALQLINAALR